jgi:hypothetical protein
VSGCIGGEYREYDLIVDRVRDPNNISEPVINLTRNDLENYPLLLSALETLFTDETATQTIRPLTTEEKDEYIELFENLGSPLDLVDFTPSYVSYENVTAEIRIGIKIEYSEILFKLAR